MRKIITLAIIAITTVIFVTVHANSDKATLRKQKREQRKEATIEQTKAAIAEQDFSFYALSYSLPFQGPVNINSTGEFFLDFYSQYLAIELPMTFAFQKEVVFSNQGATYSNYTVKDSGDGINYIITAQLSNTSNNNLKGGAPTFNDQNVNLGIHMTLNLLYRNAFLTITPDFAAPTTYRGTIILQN